MALRRPVVQTQNTPWAYNEEMPTGDTMDQHGPIDMNTIYKIVNLADPSAAQDAATKAYVDAIAAGVRDWKDSVRLATAAALPANTAAGTGIGKTLTGNVFGALSVDGVAVAVGNRILVKNEVAGENNGIYIVTTAGGIAAFYVLTRATDADTDAEVTAGLSAFATEGTANADSGWVLTTNDAIVLDTTSLAFSQFSSVVAYTFDAGLSNSAGSIAVELDTGADAQGAGSGGGNSGLEFDTAGGNGKLRAAVNPTGGFQRTASGLAALLNGPTLVTGASGLSVAKSPQVEDAFVSGEALTAFHAVAMTSTVDRVQQARGNDDARAQVIGLNVTTVGAAGSAVRIVQRGVVAGALAGATAGTPYYVQAAGGIGTTIPGGGNNIVRIGIAKNATDLIVDIREYTKKAA